MARWDEKRGCFRVVIETTRPGGKRRRQYRDIQAPNTRAGRKAAELAEAELKVEAARAAEAEWPGQTGGSETFGSYAAAWLDRKRGTWSPKTLKETRYALRRYILPTLGNTPIDRVSPAQIESLYADWAAAGRAASARRRWHGMIRTIFADAERLGELRTPNPMVRVEPAGGRAPERRVATPEEIRRVIDATRSPMTAVFFELAAASGARRGTLVALRWRDVDLAAGTVSFIQAVAVGDDGEVLKENKGGKVYAVGVAGRALEALRTQRRRAAETALALGVPGGLDNLFVFSDDGGVGHWTLGWPSHAWQEACQRAGVEGVRLHDLRHFAATRMLAAGIPPRNVADRLGCTENNVIRTYSHRVPSPEDARATEVMAAVLG
jgi:integrase